MVKLDEKKRELKLLNLLPDREVESVVQQGVSIRLPVFEGRKALAEQKIANFERKHRTTYTKLKAKGLPKKADYLFHEDFIEWGYWERVYKEADKLIRQFELIKRPIGRG